MYISSWQYRTSQIIFVYSLAQYNQAQNEELYTILSKWNYEPLFRSQMCVQRKTFRYKHITTQQDIVKLSCTIAFSTSFDCRDSVGYVYGTLWLEGIFACFKEIETYIIIIMIIIFNTIPNSTYM